MKTAFIQLCFILLAITGMHAMKAQRSAGIKGIILPENKVKNIWAVQGTDSTNVSNNDGSFDIKVKPGIWKIIILTDRSYKQYKVFENIETTEGKDTDLGTINLN